MDSIARSWKNAPQGWKVRSSRRWLHHAFLLLDSVERLLVVFDDVPLRQRYDALAAEAGLLPGQGPVLARIDPHVVLHDKLLVVARRRENPFQILADAAVNPFALAQLPS